MVISISTFTNWGNISATFYHEYLFLFLFLSLDRPDGKEFSDAQLPTLGTLGLGHACSLLISRAAAPVFLLCLFIDAL